MTEGSAEDAVAVTRPPDYRGEMYRCDECDRLQVEGLACNHGEGDTDV